MIYLKTSFVTDCIENTKGVGGGVQILMETRSNLHDEYNLRFWIYMNIYRILNKFVSMVLNTNGS